MEQNFYQFIIKKLGREKVQKLLKTICIILDLPFKFCQPIKVFFRYEFLK
jgi:hypothetical protein